MAFEEKLLNLEKEMKDFILKTLKNEHFIQERGESGLYNKIIGKGSTSGYRVFSDAVQDLIGEKKVCKYQIWEPHVKPIHYLAMGGRVEYPSTQSIIFVVLPEYIEEFKGKFKDCHIESSCHMTNEKGV